MKIPDAKTTDDLPRILMTGYDASKTLFGSIDFVALACEMMRTAGWTFHSYDENGDDLLQPPEIQHNKNGPRQMKN